MDSIETFFSRLAERMWKENQLSDVVWAFLRSVDGGPRWFLRDFLGVPIPAEARFTVSREYSLASDSRADLVFEQVEVTDGRIHVVVVENELWDRNYHFGQYEEACRKLYSGNDDGVKAVMHFAQVAAHSVPPAILQNKAEGWQVKTWQEFLAALGGARRRWGEDEVLVDGVRIYVEAIVRGFEMDVIRFDKQSLNSLFYFDRLVREVVNEATPSVVQFKAECSEYARGSARCRGPDWTGTYYRLWRGKESNSFYAFFGIYYRDDPLIYVALENDWTDASLFRKVLELKGKKGKWLEVEYEEGRKEVDIRLPAAKYEEFLGGNMEQQRTLLLHFLTEVNSLLLGIPLGKGK